MRKIELLAPARNADIGIEAIKHGADAVYIGGPSFGARAGATNSISEIARLIEFAHPFRAKVYVTINTILYDNELKNAEELITALYNIGADAIIVQDFGVMQLNIPPIAIHASTQMDTYTPQRVKFLYDAGFSQIVLARELSLRQIKSCVDMAKNTPIEVFVHGAVCVSYSGRCYASQHSFGRSANRGDCAQFCRLAFDLIDANKKIVVNNKHLLSLHDMNRSNTIEELMLAGVSSFKIEGRLKDMPYVKNITALYRNKIDIAINRHKDKFCRSSYGSTTLKFTPNAHKSFNRGFSDYFLFGRKEGQEAFDTPKAIGEYVGEVNDIQTTNFSVAGDSNFVNGDGLCFVGKNGKLVGFRVNKVENGKLFPLKMPSLYLGAKLFRNKDHNFLQTMEKETAQRVMQVEMCLKETSTGYSLTIRHEDGSDITIYDECQKDIAHKPQKDNIIKQLSKLGDTDFMATKINIETNGNRFIPSSWLTNIRRRAIEQLKTYRAEKYERERRKTPKNNTFMEMGRLTYSSNVSNNKAKEYLLNHGAESIEMAMEVAPTTTNPLLMTCKHCLRYSYGVCPKHHHRQPEWKEPLSLRLSDGKLFPIEFDCKKCEMNIYAS